MVAFSSEAPAAIMQSRVNLFTSSGVTRAPYAFRAQPHFFSDMMSNTDNFYDGVLMMLQGDDSDTNDRGIKREGVMFCKP